MIFRGGRWWGNVQGLKIWRTTADKRYPKPSQPLRWVRQLQEEFFQQGDQEQALGLPLPPLATPVTPPL